MTLYPQRTWESQETKTSIDISWINQNILNTVWNTQWIIERLWIDWGSWIISHLKPEEARNILWSADIQ